MLRLSLGIWMLASLPLLAAEPTVTVQGDTAEFKIGDDLIGRYYCGAKLAKPYLWPLNAPGNIPVTRAYPMEQAKAGGTRDHIHHKSAWFCHGDVIVEGMEPKLKLKNVQGFDFWDESPGHSFIVCTKVEKTGPASATLTNEWRTPDGRKVLDETRRVTLHDRGMGRFFVFDIDLHASVGKTTFGDTKEGSFGVRVRDELLVKDKTIQNPMSKITNADGKVDEKAVWGNVSAWCDYSGEVDGKKVGITILTDPANPVPSAWHSRDYGLMAANPFGRAKSGFPGMKGRTDLVQLNKGEHLKLRFGLYVHGGDASSVAEQAKWFAALPR